MAVTAKKIKEELSLNTEESGNTINLPDRDVRLAELAYYKAESRGFEPGHEMDDWLEAEQELML